MGEFVTVNVGGLTLHRDSNESSGFFINGDGFEGWDDGVDMRRDRVDRPGSHGAYDTAGYLDARVVSLSGRCHSKSYAESVENGLRFTGVLADGGSDVVSVERKSGVQWARGRLAAKSKWSVLSENTCLADWQMQLWFANPRKFGGENQAFGGFPSFHRGNFPAPPVHRVEGVLPAGYTIFGPAGKQYVVSRNVPAGEVHTIDMADGLLRINGVVTFGYVTRGDTWTVQPGEQFAFTANNNAVLSTVTTDTFI